MIDALFIPAKPAIIRAKPPEIVRPGDPRFEILPAMLLGLGVTALSGGGGGRVTVQTLVNSATGTPFGNYTSTGGLAKAFDGTTSETGGAAARNTGTFAAGYIGLTFASAKVISGIVTYATSDSGYNSPTGNVGIWELMGKNGVPSSATDGTSCGTWNFTDSNNNVTTQLTGLNASRLAFTNWWIRLNTPPVSATYAGIAELKMYEEV